MRSYVLIHGAWHGAWCWGGVVAELRRRKVQAVPIDLPGPGRFASGKPGIDFTDYVSHVWDVLREGGWNRVVLVGHSMAGAVIQKVAEEMPERIERLVFVAAHVLLDGQSIRDNAPPIEGVADQFQGDRESQTFRIRPEAARYLFFHDCPPKTQEWALPRLTPQPYRALTDPVKLQSFYGLGIPAQYVLCTHDRMLPPEFCRLQAGRLGIAPLTLDSGHCPMVSRPIRLADFLVG